MNKPTKVKYIDRLNKSMNNKQKQLLLVGIVLLVFLPLIFAEVQTLSPQKQYACVSLPQVCSSCTYVNLSSIKYPNSTMNNLNVAMTKNGVNFNYNFCETDQLGTYIITTCGDKDSTFQCAVYDFVVTPTGMQPSSFLNNPILIILGLLGLVLCIVGATKGIPWFGFIGSIMFLLVGIYTMIYGFDNINDMYTQGAAVVFLGMGIIFMFLASLEWIYDDSDSSGNLNETDEGDE